jgi:hypothetical protein
MMPSTLRDQLRTADWRSLRLQLIAAKHIAKDEAPELIAQRYGIMVTPHPEGGITALHPRFDRRGTNLSAFRSADPLEAVVRCLYMVLYADTRSSGISC